MTPDRWLPVWSNDTELTPDLWQAVVSNDTERPINPPDNPPDAGYVAIGPWEAMASLDCPVVFWRRPLRKINTTMDSPDVLR